MDLPNLVAIANNQIRNTNTNPSDSGIIMTSWNQVLQSEKIFLPEGGRILDDSLRGIPEILNLPYEQVCIEFVRSTRVGNLGNIILARDLTESISITSFHEKYRSISGNMWFPNFYLASINKQEMTINYNQIVLPNLYTRSSTQEIDDFRRDHIRSVRSVLELLEALSCSNVYLSQSSSDSRKIDERSSLRLPSYEYRILSIEIPIQHYYNRAYKGGSHNSPRQHLRRGHIRVYNRNTPSEYKIWINNMIIKRSSESLIEKDYYVHR